MDYKQLDPQYTTIDNDVPRSQRIWTRRQSRYIMCPYLNFQPDTLPITVNSSNKPLTQTTNSESADKTFLPGLF